jgi:hypothetical protein
MKNIIEIRTLEILSVVRLEAGPMAREKSQGFLFQAIGRKGRRELWRRKQDSPGRRRREHSIRQV